MSIAKLRFTLLVLVLCLLFLVGTWLFTEAKSVKVMCGDLIHSLQLVCVEGRG